MGERLGFVPLSSKTTGSGAIWFHAVSVGEILSAVELLRLLRTERPHQPIYVSTTTLAGRAMAEHRLANLADLVFYAPLDYKSIVRRVLRRLRPSAVVILETEIWPNLYREAKRSGASLLIVNGRISEKALPSYQRARGFFRAALQFPDAIYVQSGADAKRYVLAGAPPLKVKSAGNLKYDFRPSDGGIAIDLATFLEKLQPEKIWIAASTMPPTDSSDVDEDDIVLNAFHDVASEQKGLLLILVPRKPERFDAAAEKLKAQSISFIRRTSLPEDPGPLPSVLLLDSIGELAALFSIADVVFMGGTLARRGGHNILEAAYFAKPVIAGPHMENFAEIAREFTSERALVRIGEPAQLAREVRDLLANPAKASQIGERAKRLAASKRGVIAQIAREILKAAGEGVPNPLRTLLARLILTPLSWIWAAGHRANLSRTLPHQQRLATRVVSVGGLTMGGAGKTPMVEHLAELLHASRTNVAILTRGYRKKSPERIVIVPRGGTATVEMTGDEAQIFIRAGAAHVGIGSHRQEVGRRMERELKPDIFLLDDGFQHAALARDVDLVLIDALNPLAGGLFPLGARREPLEGLKRASAVILTRVSPGQSVSGLERLVRRYNSKIPIFRSGVVPKQWMDLEWSAPHPVTAPPFRRVAAFCGLGAPASFWRSLEQLGLEIVFEWAFGDHHSYRQGELRRIAKQAAQAGAEALVTTEKDIMNLPASAVELVLPLKIYWLKIGVEIDREADLLRLIQP